MRCIFRVCYWPFIATFSYLVRICDVTRLQLFGIFIISDVLVMLARSIHTLAMQVLCSSEDDSRVR